STGIVLGVTSTPDKIPKEILKEITANYRIISKDEVPSDVKVHWVDSWEELYKILKAPLKVRRIHENQVRTNAYVIPTPEGKIISIPIYEGALLIYAGPETLYNDSLVAPLELVGEYYVDVDEGIITSINADDIAQTYLPFWRVKSSSCNKGPTGVSTSWASAVATFEYFLGIDPIGIVVQTRTLRVSETLRVPRSK
ncbi:MAG: hypothetical protein PWQ72_2098, partial [Pseudothermotoga sp.]|nr:hypothetical protein [Pseudothermotoga sp.]